MYTVVLGWRGLSTDFYKNEISFRDKYIYDHCKDKIILQIKSMEATHKSLNMSARNNISVLITEKIYVSY